MEESQTSSKKGMGRRTKVTCVNPFTVRCFPNIGMAQDQWGIRSRPGETWATWSSGHGHGLSRAIHEHSATGFVVQRARDPATNEEGAVV